MGVVIAPYSQRRARNNVNHSLARATHSTAEITLSDLVGIYRRRRRVFYGVLLGFLSLAALYCIVCTRRYSAAAVIQIQKENPDGLGLDNMMSGPTAAVDALNAALDLQTESEVLQSDTLAIRVVEDLDLEHTKDFKGKFSPVGWLMGAISPKGVQDPPNASLEDSPGRRAHVLTVFSKNLKVKVDSGTRLIDISYLSSDPKTAAAVVNHLIQGLTDYTFQTRLSATSQASSWLSGQLGDLRKQSEDLQGKVAQLQKGMGVVSLGDSDTDGKPQIYSAVLDRLQQQTTALSAAQSNRIMKGALYQVVKSGDADLVSGLSGTSIGSSSQSVTNSFALIQNLRGQQATLQQQIAHDSAKFGPAYPTIVEQRASLDGINRSIDAEIQRVATRAKNDYEIALHTEQDTRASYESARRDAEQLNDKAVEFTIARQEADDSRALYQGLLKRLKEGGVLEGLRSSNVTVVDPGRVSDKPKTPNVPVYLAIALVAGLFSGGTMSLLLDTMDDKIQDVDELQQLCGLPLLGIVPFARQRKRTPQLEAASESASPFSEAVRGVRTSLLLSKSGVPPRVVLVTSAVSGEGKSTLSKSLAVLIAKQGRRVLLVEADLRRPKMNHLDLGGPGGLSATLASREDGKNGLDAALRPKELPTLTLLPAGPIPSDPAELLDSARMRCLIHAWRAQFDLVILDGPPALPVTDALALAGMADTTILVARCGLTARSSLRRACQLLEEHVDSRHVRIVLNGVKPGSYAFSNYYGYTTTNFYKGDGREHA
jgi:polysaccharide biosynthesis transport protein